jgi:hypothetical protein
MTVPERGTSPGPIFVDVEGLVEIFVQTVVIIDASSGY